MESGLWVDFVPSWAPLGDSDRRFGFLNYRSSFRGVDRRVAGFHETPGLPKRRDGSQMTAIWLNDFNTARSVQPDLMQRGGNVTREYAFTPCIKSRIVIGMCLSFVRDFATLMLSIF